MGERVLVTGVGCGIFVTLTRLVHRRLTMPLDRTLLDQVATRKESSSAHAALAFTTLGDAVPLLTIPVMAAVVVPAYWAGRWRPLAARTLAAPVQERPR